MWENIEWSPLSVKSKLIVLAGRVNGSLSGHFGCVSRWGCIFVDDELQFRGEESGTSAACRWNILVGSNNLCKCQAADLMTHQLAVSLASHLYFHKATSLCNLRQ